MLEFRGGYGEYPIKTKTKICWIIILFLFSVTIRIHLLDHESLYMDELLQVAYYPHSFSQIVDDASTQIQPPLDYWIGHVVYWFSQSDFAVRLPAAFFGVGAVLLIVQICSRFCSWPIVLGTGFIYSIMPFNVYFSQEARPYSIASFFFLAVLWAFEKVLSAQTVDSAKIGLLFISIVFFLNSRTLSPMVVSVSLVIILFLRYSFLVWHSKKFFSKEQKRIFILLATMVSALVFHLPALLNIFFQGVHHGYVYLGKKQNEGTGLFEFIVNFDMLPLWRAFVVQTEPLSMVLIVLVFLSPVVWWKYKSFNHSYFLLYLILLFPLAGFLNITIFQFKSAGNPFRPPYAIYLLPLTVVLASVSLQSVIDYFNCRWPHRFLVSILLCVFTSLVGIQVSYALLDMKSAKKKTDWRTLCSYLENTYDKRQIIVFDTFSQYWARWEPNFYGFGRYYHGQSSGISLRDIPMKSSDVFIGRTEEPVVIIFHWREYYLTSKSKYWFIHSSNKELQERYYLQLQTDPALEVKTFTGLSVVKLRKRVGGFSEDLYELICRIIDNVPTGSWLVEPHLTAAYLGKLTGKKGWEEHLKKAMRMSSGENHDRLNEIIQNIPF